MLEQKVASLAHFIRPFVTKEYFMNVPENFATPSAFFPIPEISCVEHSLSSYMTKYQLYLKVFDKNSFAAWEVVTEIVKAIKKAGKRIPLYDVKGKKTGKRFKLMDADTKKLDEGVIQLSLSWNTFGYYDMSEYQKAIRLYFEGLAIY